MLDWLVYPDVNPNKQAPATAASVPQLSPTAMTFGPYLNPQSMYPASVSPYWPLQPAQPANLNPQASNFQPAQRSVYEYRYQPNYRIDKSSRYNLRQRIDEQVRPYTTGTVDSVIESIEPREQGSVTKPAKSTTTAPWRRGGRRQTTPFRYTPSRDTPDRPVTPPPEPVVSRVYLAQAAHLPQILPQPQKLLVVLDLNGTLLAREKGVPQHMIKRPGVEPLLQYLFSNHVVMVCTSATGHNAKDMVQKLLTEEQQNKLVTIRPRHTFGLTQQQYATKVQIYKNLEDIWKDPAVVNAIPAGAKPWSMANSVLVDDTRLKAKAQPHNLIQVPEFEYTAIQGGKKTKAKLKATEEAIMKSVQEKLEVLKYQTNLASLIRQWQEGEKEAPGIVNEKVDQGEKVALKNENGTTPADDYPTPDSIDSTSSTESEEEYEPPEEVELVFRGRRNASRPASKTSIAAQGSLREYEPSRKIGTVPEQQEQAAQRSPSPVTEEHFAWVTR